MCPGAVEGVAVLGNFSAFSENVAWLSGPEPVALPTEQSWKILVDRVNYVCVTVKRVFVVFRV